VIANRPGPPAARGLAASAAREPDDHPGEIAKTAARAASLAFDGVTSAGREA
jgi:hypothetical protein